MWEVLPSAGQDLGFSSGFVGEIKEILLTPAKLKVVTSQFLLWNFKPGRWREKSQFLLLSVFRTISRAVRVAFGVFWEWNYCC